MIMTPIQRLIEIMKTLRGDRGCDWDKQQNWQSLKPFLLEEAYEVIDTIDRMSSEKDDSLIEHHKEELGDLLLQVVFQAQIQSELGYFDFESVVAGIVDKMERRHPHIFGDQPRDENVKGNPYWHAVKEAEQKAQASAFASIPKGQPALLRARKLGERAARYQFDWASANDALQKIHEEVDELSQAMSAHDLAHIAEEMGDLLFSIAQVARHLGIDAELALHHGNEKFVRRFLDAVDDAGGLEAFRALDAHEKEALWKKIKATAVNV